MGKQTVLGIVFRASLLVGAVMMTGIADASSKARLSPERIRSWHAPDDKTMIIKTRSGDTYRVTFMGGRCRPLKYERSVVFIPWGGGYLDNFGKISFVSPYGFRYRDHFDYSLMFEQTCRFKTLEKIQAEPVAG